MLKPAVYFVLFLITLYVIYWARGSIRRLPPYSTVGDKVWHIGFRLTVWAILLFLITPILVILPLSFNSEPYFTYPMPGFSLRWYKDFLVGEGSAVSLFFILARRIVLRRPGIPGFLFTET